MADPALQGRAILVVEDEYFIAANIGDELAQAGATVIGPAPTLAKAQALIAAAPRIDAAILDINLGNDTVFAAADLLRERAVPLLFATGYDRAVLPHRFDDVLRCEKPVGADRLGKALASIMG